jgi:CubicO group peptidase (beta-lactamase class C family)
MVKLTITCALLASSVAALGPGVPGDQASSMFRADRAIDDLVTQALSQHSIPGMSIALVENGRVVYAKGFGTTSLSEVRRPSADTQYRLASVSKPITAVGVFQLVRAGTVRLDAPAREYCPELARLNGAATVRQFLMHRTGMRHTTDSEDLNIKGAFPRLGAALERIVQEPLRFPPGTKTLYTSWGYAALGCVIEGASGLSYTDFIRRRVLEPAGMNSTTFDDPAYTSDTFSPGFRRGTIYGLRPSLVVDTRFKTPASGIISTANDLARFAIAVFDGRLVTDAAAKDMFSVTPDSDGRAVFTAGWTIDSTRSLFEYNGSMEGATAYLEIVPAQRYALAILANRERCVPQVLPIAREVRRLVRSD